MHSSTILTIAAALGCVLVCASAAPMTDAQVRGALGQAYARRSGPLLDAWLDAAWLMQVRAIASEIAALISASTTSTIMIVRQCGAACLASS